MTTPSDTQATAPRRELAAIVFSDIAGYTAIMARDEQEGLEARNSHRELLDSILPRFVFGIPGNTRFAPEPCENLVWDAVAVEIRILEVDEGGFHQ
jgi:hypothetical protein